MVLTVSLILVILALICFFLAAIGVNVPPRINLVAAGLFFWLLSSMFG